MNYPNREPRNEFKVSGNWRDCEKVVQDDGRIAHFSFISNKQEDGWTFDCFMDKYGFEIWYEENQGPEFVDLLWESKSSNFTDYDVEDALGKDFEINDGEKLYKYVYGGALSQRGGWFVVNKEGKILRSKMTWLS